MPTTPQPEELQRVGFLALLPDLLRQLNTDPAAVLVSAGLNEQALADPNGTIPYRAAARLLQVSAEQTSCPSIGLKLGRLIRIDLLGVVGKLMRNAPTLGTALLDFARHQHRNAHGGLVYLMKTPTQAFFGYAVYQPNVPGSDVICDTAAMAALSLVRELVGTEHDRILEVHLSRSQPDDKVLYNRSFGVHLRFDRGQTAVLLPRNLLDLPIRGADVSARIALETTITSFWSSGELDLVTRVRRLITVGLLSGDVRAKVIAEQVGIERKTMDRRLQVHGASFQDLLDESRCELVKQLLRNTGLSIGEIATVVGYANPGVLTRAFIRWIGNAPSTWRELTLHAQLESRQ